MHSRLTNPRHFRILTALLARNRSREELDRIAGVSNSPDEIFQLRGKGLELPCHRVQGRDCDDAPTQYGVYSLTPDDRQIARAWLDPDQAGFFDPNVAGAVALLATALLLVLPRWPL